MGLKVILILTITLCISILFSIIGVFFHQSLQLDEEKLFFKWFISMCLTIIGYSIVVYFVIPNIL